MEGQRAPSIGKIATKYGLIQGVLGFLVFLLGTMMGSRQNLSGLLSIALLIVLMVLAHREFKKTHEGMMTYPQGLGSGTLLSLIASVVTCILVYVYVKFINTGYFEAAMKLQQAELERRGITGAQADQAMAFTSMIMTPGGIVITSLISGVIVGFIVALIVSIFTKQGDPKAVI